MNSLVGDVARFHEKIGYSDAWGRGITPAILKRRLAYIDEEATEVREAMLQAISLVESGPIDDNDPAVRHVVQELVDLAYVITGTFLELGIDPEPAWQAVHAANMQKEAAPGGGKAIKPEGWQPPLIPVMPLAIDGVIPSYLLEPSRENSEANTAIST